MAKLLYKFCLLCVFLTVSVNGDYDCACNFNVEKAVYPSSDTSGTPLGYLYEFDCKPIAPDSKASSGFVGIQFERQLGFLEVDNQIQTQTCGGDPSSTDIIPPTSAPAVNGQWSDWQDWQQCVTSCGPGTRSRTRTCDNPAPSNGGKDCTGDSTDTSQCENGPCPIDGAWSSWQTWSACSVSCKEGSRTRNRKCDNPAPDFDGSPCEGVSLQTETCNDGLCPVDGVWKAWTTWSKCSVSCGGGTHSRTRTCSYPDGVPHGNDCVGSTTQSESCNADKCPVDGVWTAWTTWTQCSVTCGGGTHTRTRTCSFPADVPHGNDCVGSSTDSETCNTNLCPVDGKFSAWSTWTQCSVTCGGGTHTRTRTCSYPVGVPHGNACVGDTTDSQSCNTDKCPVDGTWSTWASWSKCSVTCGGGTHARTRTCDFPADAPHGNDCVGSSAESGTCNTDTCPVDGVWTAWTTWSKCSVTCGGGSHTRTRTCSYPDGVPHGNVCVGSPTDSETCNNDKCPVDGVFTTWTTWSKCSVTCGGGTHTRTRSCSFPADAPHGHDCVGPVTDSETCNTNKCPVDGSLTTWTTWSKCSVTCGGGTHTRTRTCSFPADAPHGNNCVGSLADSETCNTNKCPVDGSLTAWTTWSKCSVTCGGGTHTRTRTCSFPADAPHGNDCVGPVTDSETCNTNKCPVDGSLTAWTTWSKCSVTCGGGTHTRNRTCSFPADAPRGNDCVGSLTDSETCNANKCPVDGSLTAWTTWSKCSVTCGGGTHTRNRTCSFPADAPRGNDCVGSLTDSETCNANKCPVDGSLTAWTTWSKCSVTCGGGTHTRTRTCSFPADAPRGNDCVGSLTDSETCNTNKCPVDGVWTAWSSWTQCSVTCGGGTHIRSRTCSYPNGVPHGNDCAGLPTESESCNTNLCPVDGAWNAWSTWAQCSTTCGGGTHTRTRNCIYPANVPHGNHCVGSSNDTQSCNTNLCPVDGVWSHWSSWSACPVTCGGGTHSRHRTCDYSSTAPHGKPCVGSASASQTCGTNPCPVDGVWSQWSYWSSCSLTCGGGTHTRTRACFYPPQVPHGQACVGSSSSSEQCNTQHCPVDGVWSQWSSWSSCSLTCGGGTNTRNRACYYPPNVPHGQACVGASTSSGSCNTQHCPVDGHWASWQSWSHCSVTCSDGTRTRTRTCTNPAPQYNGHNCAGSNHETGHCNDRHCPIDGQWGSWSSYGACSVTCETGRKTRTRQCNHPAPQYGGHNCPGTASSFVICELDACIVNVTGTPYEYVGVGYNLLTGNPETINAGPLASRRIFEMTGTSSSVREVTYDKHTTCSPTKSTILLHGSKAYQDELKNLIKPDGTHNTHVLDAAFTYNSQFESMRNNLDNKDTVYLDKVTTCVLGTLTYNTGGSSKYDGSFSISKEFAKDVCALPVDLTAASSNTYMAFFDKWGTSIVTSIDVGTKTTDRYTTTPSQVYEYVQKTDPKLFEASGMFAGFNASVAINTHDYSNSAAVAGTYGVKQTTNMGTSQKLAPVGGEVISITEALNPKFWQTVIDGLVNTHICPSSIKTGGLQNYADNLHMALGQYPSYKDQQTGYNYSHTQLLDRHNIQVPVVWPRGTYGLMQTVTGCPSGYTGWKGGYIVQDTEDSTHNNAYSANLDSYMQGRFLSTSVRTEFCIKTTVSSTSASTYEHEWPSGTYCLLKYKTCPSGFSEGFITWDDENTNNGNSHHGYLPDGVYGVDTTIRYCCRHDGSPSTPIYLPTESNFILVRYDKTCQTIVGMSFKQLYIQWDTQSSANKDAVGGVHPYDDGGAGYHKLHFCYYETVVPAAPPLIG